MSGHTPTASTPGAVGDRKSLVKAFAASLSGTTLEWYDFAVYGAAAALVFGDLFFPSDEPLTGTMLAFGTYAAGYVARPIGGIVFGRLGDRVGRKRVLVWTLMLIGVATVLIGLLPTHGQVGLLAPILLVVLRFAQGVGVGGEWGGAVLLSSEYSTPESRGFWASAAQVGPPLGNVLANAVLGILAASLSDAAFESWGWRVAFLLSGILVAFGLWIRTRLEDTPVFREIEARGDFAEEPIKDILRDHPRGLASGILCRVGPDVLYAMFVVFVLTYATDQLDFSKGEALTAVMIASLIEVPLIPFAGWLSDRIDRRLVYGVAAVGAAIWVWVFLAMTRSGGMASLVIGVTVALALHAFMYGPQAAYIAEQFHARLRYTGTSLAYTFAGIIGGAVAPAAMTWLLSKDESGSTVAAYVGVAMLVTLVGLAIGRVVVDDVDVAPAKVSVRS